MLHRISRCSRCAISVRRALVLIHGLDGARRLHADEHANWKKHGRPTPIREVTGEEPNQDQN